MQQLIVVLVKKPMSIPRRLILSAVGMLLCFQGISESVPDASIHHWLAS